MLNVTPARRLQSVFESKNATVRRISLTCFLAAAAVWPSLSSSLAHAAQLTAGAAKVDITDREAGPVNDPLFVKALVLKSDATTAVLITVDAVAIGEIGRIKNDYLPKVRRGWSRSLAFRRRTC